MKNKTRQQVENKELEKIEKYMESQNNNDNSLKSKSYKQSNFTQNDRNKKWLCSSSSVIYSFIISIIIFFTSMSIINSLEFTANTWWELLWVCLKLCFVLLLYLLVMASFWWFIISCVMYIISFFKRFIKRKN